MSGSRKVWALVGVGLSVLALVVLFLVVGACKRIAGRVMQKEPFLVEDVHCIYEPDGGRYIEGTFTNQGDYSYEVVYVSFTLYDDYNAVICVAADTTYDGLAPGQRWNFKCPVLASGNVHFYPDHVLVEGFDTFIVD